MTKSKQSITSSSIKGNILQRTDAEIANQSVDDVQAQSIEQAVESSSLDLVTLSQELATLRAAMREAASTPDEDISIGAVAAAENAAHEGDEKSVLEHLSGAGKWALEISSKIGVSVAVAALKKALGL